MRYLKLKQSIFEKSMTILLLLPIASYIIYTLLGIFINFNTLNFILYIIFIILLITSLKNIGIQAIKFLKIFSIILSLNLLGHLINQGGGGIIDFFKTISGYYIFIIIGILMYILYWRSNNLNRLLRIVIRMGIFISIVNLLHYIYISTDNYIHSNWSIEFNNYQTMVDYLQLLNKSFYDYILIGLNYDNLLRPVGFFYDTHSQYYFPLASCIIILFNRKFIKNPFFWICFMLSTVLLSSIKTAIMTIIILLTIWILLNVNIKKISKYVFPVILVVAIVFREIIFTILLGDNLVKISFQLFNHIIFIPFKFIGYNIIGFFIGGASFLRDDPYFYSEVFWITVTFYIGLIGLIMYLFPMRLLRSINNSQWSLGAYLYLMFFLSLMHYGVYSVGVNNIVSALPIMYYLAYQNEKYIHKTNR